MYFRDRTHAGELLAQALMHYKDFENGVVIGLPRGGIPVAYEIAKRLLLPLDIVCPRKIGAPFNPEFAIGAVTETGEGELNKAVIVESGVTDEYLEKTIEKEKKEALHRLTLYRSGLPERILAGKVVILVDDGLATGSTMKAAIRSIRSEGASQIIVAIPVSPPDTLEEVRKMVDEVVCLESPPFFQAVGQFYDNFNQTSDREVIELIKTANKI